MDPISLATLTAAATTLATKALEGFGGEAGKHLWSRVKHKLGWSEDPPPVELPQRLAEQFQGDEAIARQVLELLQTDPDAPAAGVQQLVGNLQTNGGKVVVIGKQETTGDIINNF